MQEAEALLRDVVFDEWTKAACEDYTDTLKFMNLIDVFLPYLPLGRQHMGQLAELGLQQRRHYLARQRIHLTWQPGVVDFVAGKVRCGLQVEQGFDPVAQ
jgi:ATP-dependent Clp protease ATP-binding subunit ClpA